VYIAVTVFVRVASTVSLQTNLVKQTLKLGKTKIRQQKSANKNFPRQKSAKRSSGETWQDKLANKLCKTKIRQLQKSAKRSPGKTWQDKNQPNTKINQDKFW